MTEAEIRTWLDDHAEYLLGDEFLERLVELDRRLSIEPLSAQQCADAIGVPVDVFVYRRTNAFLHNFFRQAADDLFEQVETPDDITLH